MIGCAKMRALRSCSGDVHVARVVVSLVVHAVLGLTLGLIAHVVVFVVTILHRIFYIWKYTLYTPVSDGKLLFAVTELITVISAPKKISRIIPRIIGPITVSQVFPDRSVLDPSSR